jgi:hypothetical protein
MFGDAAFLLNRPVGGSTKLAEFKSGEPNGFFLYLP